MMIAWSHTHSFNLTIFIMVMLFLERAFTLKQERGPAKFLFTYCWISKYLPNNWSHNYDGWMVDRMMDGGWNDGEAFQGHQWILQQRKINSPLQCCTKNKILGRPTDHPWGKSGWSVFFLAGPSLLLYVPKSAMPKHAQIDVVRPSS